MVVQRNGWTDNQMNGLADGGTDGGTDKWMDGQINGWTGGWVTDQEGIFVN